MSKQIIQLNEENIKIELKELVKKTIEETLNNFIEDESKTLLNAEKYERSNLRKGYRAGHYEREFTTASGQVNLKIPKLKGILFQTAILERYKRRESSFEEAMIEMYLAGVSVRRINDIAEILSEKSISSSAISQLNKTVYEKIEKWRNRSLNEHKYSYLYVDGTYLKCNYGGSFENIGILIAVGVNDEGFREIVGASVGVREDKESWLAFFRNLKERGLKGLKLVVGDKCQGLVVAAQEVYPEAKYQRCIVHFYRNVFSVVPKSKRKEISLALKAIHSQETRKDAQEKALAVTKKLQEMKLKEAANKVINGIPETLTYYDFPVEHYQKIRTTNVIERVNREVKRRTSVAGGFPDLESALMLVCSRLNYIANSDWGNVKYMNVELINQI